MAEVDTSVDWDAFAAIVVIAGPGARGAWRAFNFVGALTASNPMLRSSIFAIQPRSITATGLTEALQGAEHWTPVGAAAGFLIDATLLSDDTGGALRHDVATAAKASRKNATAIVSLSSIAIGHQHFLHIQTEASPAQEPITPLAHDDRDSSVSIYELSLALLHRESSHLTSLEQLLYTIDRLYQQGLVSLQHHRKRFTEGSVLITDEGRAVISSGADKSRGAADVGKPIAPSDREVLEAIWTIPQGRDAIEAGAGINSVAMSTAERAVTRPVQRAQHPDFLILEALRSKGLVVTELLGPRVQAVRDHRRADLDAIPILEGASSLRDMILCSDGGVPLIATDPEAGFVTEFCRGLGLPPSESLALKARAKRALFWDMSIPSRMLLTGI